MADNALRITHYVVKVVALSVHVFTVKWSVVCRALLVQRATERRVARRKHFGLCTTLLYLLVLLLLESIS